MVGLVPGHSDDQRNVHTVYYRDKVCEACSNKPMWLTNHKI